MTISVNGWSNGNGGTHHYRIAEPLRALSLSGFRTMWGPEMSAEIQRDYDIILTHMPHEPIPSAIMRSLRDGGHNKLVVDIDDFAWGYPEGSGTETYWTRERLTNLENNLRLADLVTTPSPVLADYVRQFNPWVEVLPNTVPVLTTVQSRKPSQKFRIGYQGASQHKLDFTHEIMSALSMFLASHSDSELWLFGFHRDSVFIPPSMGGRIHIVGWQSNLSEYYKSLQFEVGIGPLASNEFNRYKSDIRYVEYMATGALPILQNYGPYEGTANSFANAQQMFRNLQTAYRSWIMLPRAWGENQFKRRQIARTFMATESSYNLERISDVYRRVAVRDRNHGS